MTFPRRRVRPPRYAQNPVTPELQGELLARSQGKCEMTGCTNRATDPHHRLLRAHGGKETLDNLRLVCRSCHRRIHDSPGESYANGWLVKSFDNPETVPWQ